MTGSNARGHLLLHATDAARAPHAFGGQPELGSRPGASYVLAWEVGWYADARRVPAGAPAARRAPGHRSPRAGGRSRSGARDGAVSCARPDGVTVSATASCGPSARGRPTSRSRTAAVASRVAVSWHAPLEEVVRRRVRFILDHQRASHRAGPGAGALLPFDVEQGLAVLASGWADFSDARERLGMGLLLQEALAPRLRRRRGGGRGGARGLPALRRRVRPHARPPAARGLPPARREPPALYDVPWLVLLFAAHDPDRALRVLAGTTAAAGSASSRSGPGSRRARSPRAARPRAATRTPPRSPGCSRGHAARCVEAGGELPAHEVNYEQSMVAPLLEILCVAATATATRPRRGLDDAIAAACRGCSPSAARSPTCGCATSRSATGTATGSGASSCGATCSRTTGAR